LFMTVKTITKLNLGHSEIIIWNRNLKKIAVVHDSRSSSNAEFGHFTLLFCRGEQSNVPIIKTHLNSHCSAY